MWGFGLFENRKTVGKRWTLTLLRKSHVIICFPVFIEFVEFK